MFKKYRHKESDEVIQAKHIYTNLYRDEKVKIFQLKPDWKLKTVLFTEQELNQQYEPIE